MSDTIVTQVEATATAHINNHFITYQTYKPIVFLHNIPSHRFPKRNLSDRAGRVCFYT